jgi:hypothetical protein
VFTLFGALARLGFDYNRKHFGCHHVIIRYTWPEMDYSSHFCTVLAKLYRWEEARPRVAVKLHTLDINVTIMHRTPKLEQDASPRTVTVSAGQLQVGLKGLHGWMELDCNLALVLGNKEPRMRG